MNDFLNLLMNDPGFQQHMNLMLGRPANTPQFGQMDPNAGALAGLGPSPYIAPAGQPGTFRLAHQPFEGNPFTYGLAGGEHNFFTRDYGSTPAAAAPAPAAPTGANQAEIDAKKLADQQEEQTMGD